MIFMRTVGTDKVRLCQVKTYYTDLSVTSLWMAVNRIHDPQICPNTKMKHSFIDIHDTSDMYTGREN